MRVALAVVLALLIAPASAGAFARPILPPMPPIVHAQCPDTDDPEVAGCLMPDAIYLGRWADRETLNHEAGHVYDVAYLDDAERTSLMRLFGVNEWLPSGDNITTEYHAVAGSEVFADRYAHCRLDGRLAGDANWRKAGLPRFRDHYRDVVCGMIARARFTAR